MLQYGTVEPHTLDLLKELMTIENGIRLFSIPDIHYGDENRCHPEKPNLEDVAFSFPTQAKLFTFY